MTDAQKVQAELERIEKTFTDGYEKRLQPIEERLEKNQEAVNNLLAEAKRSKQFGYAPGLKTFGEAFAEEIAKPENFEAINNIGKGRSHTMILKSVGTMTTSANLTGDPVMSYSQRQGLIPAQKVNFRDLIPMVRTESGQYVHYRETAGEGSIGNQTEGSSKSQIDFDLTEIKTVQKYVSGFTRFSKQLAKNLPFFQGTLPRLLLREFYQQENDYFKSTAAAGATGSTTTLETDDVKQIMDYIASRRDADFNVSFALVNHASYAALNKLTYVNGYYQNSGGVVSGRDGTTMISNVPIVPVSWMNSGKVLLIDNDYIERIEGDSLKIEFFEQDGDNVTKNLITARIECFEELNLLRTDAHTWATL